MDISKSPSTPHIRIDTAILQYRRQHGISQRAFGQLLGVSPQAVYKWEHGINYPDITLLPALASLLGVSIASLFGEQASTFVIAKHRVNRHFLYREKENTMYTDYTKLWKLLIDKGITKTDLCRATGISTRTLSKLVNNQSVTTDTLLTICEVLDCGVEHIMEFTKEPPRGTLFTAYRLHKKNGTTCGALRVVEFEYEGKRYKVGCTMERANRHTVIHCRPSGVVWEQIYPMGVAPTRTENVIATPSFSEPGKVCILLIDGAPANIVGLDEGIYLSAKREYMGDSLYVMSLPAFKLFR